MTKLLGKKCQKKISQGYTGLENPKLTKKAGRDKEDANRNML
jgi:hypothetical protein